MEYHNCPITHERFVHPVILPMCGHTLDKFVIEKMQKHSCPICQTPFTPDFTPTNWTVANMLDLHLTHDTSSVILSAKKAKELSNIFINKKVFDILDKINKKITNACTESKFTTTCFLNRENNKYIINLIIDRLRRENYIVTDYYDNSNNDYKLIIDWS